MKFGKVVLGGLMLAAVPLAAIADDMSYSYVDAAYINTDINGVSESADGFALRGSVAFAGTWFAFGEFVTQSIQNIDIESFAAGVGGHWGLGKDFDVVGSLGYFQVDLSGGGANGNDSGYLATLGLRGRVADGVELEGGVRYTDLSDGGNSTALYAGGRFHFNETWALGAEYQDSDDSSSILAYVRANF
jgi:hypothetical protein